MDEWNDSTEDLPSKRDFDPAGGLLDALYAWENFGGLSRKAAYDKFCQRPEVYNEDFTFMGGVAFVYYYPVIERYILDARTDGDDVPAMSILASCIGFHYDDGVIDYSLRARILGLIHHVRSNLAQYCLHPDDQFEIDNAWLELENRMRAGHLPPASQT